MKTTAQILRSKPDQTVHTMVPTASAYEAARFMADKNIGALVVMERGKVVGIVSERDCTRKLVARACPEFWCAGQNRQDVVNARVIRRRPNQPRRPRVMRPRS